MIGSTNSVLARLCAPLVAAVLLMMIPLSAIASDTSIAVGVPESATPGDRVELTVWVTSAGEPVDGALVSLTYRASFADVSGTVELDRGMTGADGVAVLFFEQRSPDSVEMQVSYIGPDEVDVAPAVFTIPVHPGAGQQHRSESGIDVWWLNGWILIAVIMGIWALIAYSAIQLVAVSRGGDNLPEKTPVGATVGSERGSTWLSFVLAAFTIATAIGIAIVFVRNPLTHANLDLPEGYHRTPIAFIGEEYPYLGVGLDDPLLAESADPSNDGAMTFFQLGCGGCHGLAGGGGTVASALAGEVGSSGGFGEDVREGPKNMPGYGPDVLSDDQLADIHVYLREN